MEADKRITTRERGLRDPIWQAIGAFIGLVALAAAVWFFFLQRDVKSVQVVVLAETSLLEIPSLVAGDVQVLYQGKPIPNLTLVQVKVENNGTAEVRSADYETPITLAFPEGTEVLSAQVLETRPVDLGLGVEMQGSKAVLSPVLLNGGDRAIIRFVLAGVPAEWSADLLGVSGRIAGVKELDVVSAVAEPQSDLLVLISNTVARMPRGGLMLVGSITFLLVFILIRSYSRRRY